MPPWPPADPWSWTATGALGAGGSVDQGRELLDRRLFGLGHCWTPAPIEATRTGGFLLALRAPSRLRHRSLENGVVAGPVFGRPVTRVGLCLIDLKLARLVGDPKHLNSLVDVARLCRLRAGDQPMAPKSSLAGMCSHQHCTRGSRCRSGCRLGATRVSSWSSRRRSSIRECGRC